MSQFELSSRTDVTPQAGKQSRQDELGLNYCTQTAQARRATLWVSARRWDQVRPNDGCHATVQHDMPQTAAHSRQGGRNLYTKALQTRPVGIVTDQLRYNSNVCTAMCVATLAAGNLTVDLTSYMCATTRCKREALKQQKHSHHTTNQTSTNMCWYAYMAGLVQITVAGLVVPRLCFPAGRILCMRGITEPTKPVCQHAVKAKCHPGRFKLLQTNRARTAQMHEKSKHTSPKGAPAGSPNKQAQAYQTARQDTAAKKCAAVRPWTQ
jgi:hypothetical protein